MATVRAIRIRLLACCTPHPGPVGADRPPLTKDQEDQEATPILSLPAPIVHDNGIKPKVHARLCSRVPDPTLRGRDSCRATVPCKRGDFTLAQPNRNHHEHHRYEHNLRSPA
jgi:hypothetical protein